MKDPKMNKFTYRHAIDENRAVELLSFAVGKVRNEVSSNKNVHVMTIISAVILLCRSTY